MCCTLTRISDKSGLENRFRIGLFETNNVDTHVDGYNDDFYGSRENHHVYSTCMLIYARKSTVVNA